MTLKTETLSTLKKYFLEGIKSPRDRMVGVEWEKIGVYKKSGKAIRYSGPAGVEAIFKKLIKKYGWEGIYSGKNVVALRKNDASITLEPGGQIELSGQKAKTLDENAAELCEHLKEIKEVSMPMGIAWLGIGMQPVSRLEEIEWVPKERYKIMRQRLKKKGPLTYAMMKQTASVQISLDFTSEEDAVKKLRLAMGLAPILSAIFANSPISEGKPNGFYSKRCHIWRHTAPERTGIIARVFDPDFNLDDYVEFALDVPLLFIVREGRWVPVRGMTFRDFVKNGLGHLRTIPADWDLHLTTIFTEARLKKYLEIRSIDCQKTALGLAAPALLKGLFYDETASKKAWELVSGLRLRERVKLVQEVPLKGLKTDFKGRPMLETASRLLEIGEEGLARNEAKYLAPLKDILLKRKITPAEILMGCFNQQGDSREAKIKRLISCCEI